MCVRVGQIKWDGVCVLPCTYTFILYTSIKNNEIEGWSRDGRLKKYINKICRVNHIHYIHPTLAFLDYHVPVDGDSYVGAILNLSLVCM